MDETTKKVLIGSGVVTGLGVLGYLFLKPGTAHAKGLVPADDTKPPPVAVKPPPVTPAKPPPPKKDPVPVPTPLPSVYTVKAGDTPATVAGRLGISENMLYASNPVLDHSHFSHPMFSFKSTKEMGGPYPPAGTTYTPTFQAMHGTLYPVFRSSVAGPGRLIYWAFMEPDGVPLAMTNPGFGRIYSGDGGMTLVGPWYTDMKLNTTPGSSGGAVADDVIGGTSGGASGAGGKVSG